MRAREFVSPEYSGTRLERYIVAVIKVCGSVSGGLLVLLMLVTAYHVVTRYALNKPILGLTEITGMFMTTVVALLGAYVLVAERHVTIGVIVDRFSERTQAIIDSVTYILGLAAVIIAAWRSLDYGISMMATSETFLVLPIPNFPFFLILGIGWGLFAVAIAMHLVHLLAKAVKK